MSVDNVSIDDLDLSDNIKTKLKNGAGIYNVGQLKEHTDADLMAIDNFGRASVAKVRSAVSNYTPPETPGEPEPAFANGPRNTGRPNTQREANLQAAAERSQVAALNAQQELRDLQKRFRGLCDDLLGAGNSPDQLRHYWPGYQSPEERGE